MKIWSDIVGSLNFVYCLFSFLCLNIFKNHNFIGCLIYEVFSGLRLGKTEELRITGSIPKVSSIIFFSFMVLWLHIVIKGYLIYVCWLIFMFYYLKSSFFTSMLFFFVSQSLLPDYQRLLSSLPSRRLNTSKLIENSGEFSLMYLLLIICGNGSPNIVVVLHLSLKHSCIFWFIL